MKKCGMCGREGTAPDVRGVKSAGVNVGNYRKAADVDVTLCGECAERVMERALGVALVELGKVES